MNLKLTCKECGRPFVFSEGEQRYYLEKGLKPPKRCKLCRNSISVTGLGTKSSSYFQNANIYGPGVSVSGGLSIEYSYYVELDNKYMAVKDEGIIFVNSKTECTFFNNKQEAVEHIEQLDAEQKLKAKVMSESRYQTIRI